LKYSYKNDVDVVRKEKFKFKFYFLKIYSSDDSKLIVLDNDYFDVIGVELT